MPPNISLDYQYIIHVFDLTDDNFKPALTFRLDSSGYFLGLNQSIDGDEYEDLQITKWRTNYIFSGGTTLDSIPDFKIPGTCDGYAGNLVVPIGDVTGDGVNDIGVSTSSNFISNCFKIFKGQAKTTSITEFSQPNFSLKTFKTTSTHFTISFTLLKESPIMLSLFDMKGKLVKVLKEGMFESGEQSFVWDSGAMPQGAYVLQLTADGKTETEKILISH